MINTIESLIKRDKSIDMKYLYRYDFNSDVSEKYMKRYHQALCLTVSLDKKQQKRGARILKGVIIDLQAEKLKLDLEIGELVTETNMELVPQALVIQNSLRTLCKELFDTDYFVHVVLGKLLELTRQIIRDQVTEKIGLEKILFEFFETKDFKHTRENKQVFQSIADYTDTVDTLKVYARTILADIKETRDADKIQLRISELREKINDLRMQQEQMRVLKVVVL